MYWLITTRLGGELQQPITGSTFGCEKIRSLGYSSLKSLDILGVHSLRARILAAISLPCHFPRQVSPLGLQTQLQLIERSSPMKDNNAHVVAIFV